MNLREAKEIIDSVESLSGLDRLNVLSKAGSLYWAAKGFIEAVERFKRLEDYLEHTRSCILSFQEAGEPTPEGGYRQKFKGQWYQSRPVDETPKCDCGLKDLWQSYRHSVLGVAAFDKAVNGDRK